MPGSVRCAEQARNPDRLVGWGTPRERAHRGLRVVLTHDSAVVLAVLHYLAPLAIGSAGTAALAGIGKVAVEDAARSIATAEDGADGAGLVLVREVAVAVLVYVALVGTARLLLHRVVLVAGGGQFALHRQGYVAVALLVLASIVALAYLQHIGIVRTTNLVLVAVVA